MGRYREMLYNTFFDYFNYFCYVQYLNVDVDTTGLQFLSSNTRSGCTIVSSNSSADVNSKQFPDK